jgi:NADPH-dependent 2,4-dienoyl-CoA reductase/sulfur reductase-like enzyme/nitrite reductase/ring-hydroxylating ferredoxin subunit
MSIKPSMTAGNEEHRMAHATKLSGPDFTLGIPVRDLPENIPILGHVQGEPVVLVRTGMNVRAAGATCSHYGGPLAQGLVVGETLRCPWHHARFDLRTGDPVGAPALNPIACYQVQRRGDRILVGAKQSRPSTVLPLKSPAAIVIVGAGAAGAAATEQLRQLGYANPITLIGDEAPGPVDRPNLSKDYLAGTAPEEWLSLRTRKFYDEIDVDLIVGDRVVALDAARKIVALASGRTFSYDALLLATGAEPVRPRIEGTTLSHVFTLRTLADARGIIQTAKTARRAVVVGSSFIGLEVAASLRSRGLEVDGVSRDRLPLERVLGAQVGQFIQELHEERGVRFHLSSGFRAIHQRAVELDDGRLLAADLVVLGVGVRPRTGLAHAAGLQAADGIIVDVALRTSAPDVWAAGDVARYAVPSLGTTLRIEHWVAAERQGQAVARDMLGVGTPFRDLPFFWSQHYDVTLAYVGHASNQDAAAITGSLAKRDATVAYRRAGRVVAVATIGRDQQSLAIEAALERDDESAVEALLAEEPKRDLVRKAAKAM